MYYIYYIPIAPGYKTGYIAPNIYKKQEYGNQRQPDVVPAYPIHSPNRILRHSYPVFEKNAVNLLLSLNKLTGYQGSALRAASSTLFPIGIIFR